MAVTAPRPTTPAVQKDAAQAIQVALQYHQTGAFKEAEQIYRDFLKVYPDNPDVLHLLGLIAAQYKQFDEAIGLIQRAIGINGKSSIYHGNLGNVFQEQGALEKAIDAYRRALKLEPESSSTHLNLANALQKLGRSSEAIKSYFQSLSLKPDSPEACNNLGNALNDQGEFQEAASYYERALKLKPDFHVAHSNYLLMLNYRDDLGAEKIFEEHVKFGSQQAALLEALPPVYMNEVDAGRRLKIGYVSPDFREHPVGYFIENIIINHNRPDFEVYCYYSHPMRDEVTRRLEKKADHWVQCAGMADSELAEKIRQDRIDILVDLAGHTAGNRLMVFARKPAPIQVSYLGYANTTGLRAIDYRITDTFLDPPGKSELFNTENLIRIPGSSFSYCPPAGAPEVNDAPVATNGFVTFGSFNNLSKVTPFILQLWARVLLAVPGSRLVIKAKALTDENARQSLLVRFAQHGVDGSRLTLLGWTPFHQHLEAYRNIDIFLDTFPFSLLTNTCEALWMGVPVVTLAGDRHASRLGVSILSDLGLSAGVTTTPEGYIQACINLGGDTASLATLRASLRERMKGARLTNGKAFVIDLEAAYRRVWQDWCSASGSAPFQPLTAEPKKVLHVGCGHPDAGLLPEQFKGDEWSEIRLDLDPEVKPDYVASITDMQPVASDTMDAVYSSHNVEHLFPHQVPIALREFCRVLKPGGFLLVTLPDLQAAAELIANDKAHEVAYMSPAGPITALDMVYGFSYFIDHNNMFMLHKTGFTASTLKKSLLDAGFNQVTVQRKQFSLWAVAYKGNLPARRQKI